MKSIKKPKRDQAVYVGGAYFKYGASISALTPIPKTRHSNRARTCAAAPFIYRSRRARIARLLFQFHVPLSQVDESIIAATLLLFNAAVIRVGTSNLSYNTISIDDNRCYRCTPFMALDVRHGLCSAALLQLPCEKPCPVSPFVGTAFLAHLFSVVTFLKRSERSWLGRR